MLINISQIVSHVWAVPSRPERRRMEKFHIYTPVAKGKPKPDKIDIFMSFFTPGKENAIKRDDLTQKCVDAGLVNKDSSKENQDRAMRKLIERAKVDYKFCITNDGKGEGYYIPTPKDAVRLARNNKREDKKAISTFRSTKVNKALTEDFKYGRVGEVT